jgi:hypothetical protein
MSRYLLLLLVNIPFILAGILTAITQYKLGNSSKGRLLLQIGFWILLFICLALTQSIYETLFANGLTQTESLSLFDVVQITLIVTLLYIVNRLRLKVEAIDKRSRDLHQELSIKFSQLNKK